VSTKHLRLPRHTAAWLAWLALLAYLAAAGLGGWALHRETTARRSLERADVRRKIAELEDMEHAGAIIRQVKSLDPYWVAPSPKPALYLVRGGVR
jgi:hypothetical protein